MKCTTAIEFKTSRMDAIFSFKPLVCFWLKFPIFEDAKTEVISKQLLVGNFSTTALCIFHLCFPCGNSYIKLLVGNFSTTALCIFHLCFSCDNSCTLSYAIVFALFGHDRSSEQDHF